VRFFTAEDAEGAEDEAIHLDAVGVLSGVDRAPQSSTE
jgi:hypothetical protein